MGDGIRIANGPCSWGVLEFDLEGATAEPGQVLSETFGEILGNKKASFRFRLGWTQTFTS